MKLNKIDEVLNSVNSLFKWRFRFVLIQKFCYHGNVTQRLLLSVARITLIDWFLTEKDFFFFLARFPFFTFFQFVSHPVVYNLLNSRWYRSFNAVRKQPWTSLRRWGYMLLSFWTVIDIVVFPFLFAFFYILHFIYLWLRKLRGL